MSEGSVPVQLYLLHGVCVHGLHGVCVRERKEACTGVRARVFVSHLSFPPLPTNCVSVCVSHFVTGVRG